MEAKFIDKDHGIVAVSLSQFRIYSERLNYFGHERDHPPWGAAPTAEPGRWNERSE